MVGRPRGDLLTEVVDPASDRPVFRQIADHLRGLITSGQLAPGELLPSESQLVMHYGVTRTTARVALARAEGRGPGGVRAWEGQLCPAPTAGATARVGSVRAEWSEVAERNGDPT